MKDSEKKLLSAEEVMTTVVYDFQLPISTIISAAEMAKEILDDDGEIDRETIRQCLDIIVRSGNFLMEFYDQARESYRQRKEVGSD
jgi:hypothetical protein